MSNIEWKRAFAQSIRQAMRVTGFTSEDVASHLHISPTTVRKAYAENSTARMETQLDVLCALGVKVTVTVDNRAILKAARVEERATKKRARGSVTP